MEALVRLKEDSAWKAWIAGGAQKAGESDYLSELVAAAERGGIADRVQFLGQRSDVARLMAAADIYCQPNTGPEPFGIAFVEALYSGLPVVTSDLGGAKEIVTDTCGVLCPPGDASAVASSLRELIANAKRRCALVAPARGGTLRSSETDVAIVEVGCRSGARMKFEVEDRAKQSGGTSADPIYRMVATTLEGRHAGGGRLLDVGCGRGELWPFVADRFASYAGADVLRHEGFPADAEFHKIDLDRGRVPLPDANADVVASVETIEHLENPRAFARELTRLVKPGGWVVVSTPNQLSLLSKLTLVLKNEFNAFRAGSYPAHLTALLEIDLRRIANECGWVEVAVAYSRHGRVPGLRRNWPGGLLLVRAFSDNGLVIGRKSLCKS